MDTAFDIIRKPRIDLIKKVKELSAEQLNHVPPGFNNNIAWNLGHLVATQQGICYVRAGLGLKVDESFYLLYKAGSRPAGLIDEKGISNIYDLLVSTIDEFEADYKHSMFTNYTAWTTRSGIEINDIDTLLRFLPYHDGLHAGTIAALAKIVTQ